MRVFIAIPLNEEIHRELLLLQDRLRKSNADVKWANPSNIHLTLKFLGKIDDKQFENIKSSLKEIIKPHKPFDIYLSSIGAFPNINFPHVIWVGVDKGKKESGNLQKDIETVLLKIGFEKEKHGFTPHLTLGRVRSEKNKSQLIEAMEKEKDFTSQGKVSVNKITLFQSTLTAKGPIYTPLAEFQFG